MGMLTILRKMRQKEREMRLLILGLDNAGKTTILKRFNGEDIDQISPTLASKSDVALCCQYLWAVIPKEYHRSAMNEQIRNPSDRLGFNIQTFEHKSYKLNCWDVGGQKSLRSYWRNYFEQTDGLIWVVDSADRLRLNDCKRELAALLLEERLAGATLLVFANKQDLPGALTATEIQDALGLDEIPSHHWQILPCSARTGTNLLEGVDWIVNDIAARVFTMD